MLELKNSNSLAKTIIETLVFSCLSCSSGIRKLVFNIFSQRTFFSRLGPVHPAFLVLARNVKLNSISFRLTLNYLFTFPLLLLLLLLLLLFFYYYYFYYYYYFEASYVQSNVVILTNIWRGSDDITRGSLQTFSQVNKKYKNKTNLHHQTHHGYLAHSKALSSFPSFPQSGTRL